MTRDIASHQAVIFSGVASLMSQVPSPSAAAWLIDLSRSGGPRYVVFRRDEGDARRALAAHLVDIGSVRSPIDAATLVERATCHSIGVVW